MSNIINGKQLAKSLRLSIKKEIKKISLENNFTPTLGVILVGDNPASRVYVKNKAEKAKKIGMNSQLIILPSTATQDKVLSTIQDMATNNYYDGILLQLPLPSHLDTQLLLSAIPWQKDVDGLHPYNAGRLMLGQPGIVPCTALGCILLIKKAKTNLNGLNAVIIGRSNIVGKPVSQLLLANNCTTTIIHSHTKVPQELTNKADILVAAIGRPNFITEEWIKPGSIVIDVGINRINDSTGKQKLCGDINFEQVHNKCSHITPVPGGVGPLTIACLLSNTLDCACSLRGLNQPKIAHNY